MIYLDVASLRAGSCYFGNSQASCYPVTEAHPHLQLKAADDTAWVWGLVFLVVDQHCHILDMPGYHPMISPFLTYSRNSIEKQGLFLCLSNYHMIEKLSSSNSLALFIGNMDTAPNCEPLVHHWIATLSNIAMFGYLWISPFFTYIRMELYGFYILEKRWTSISQVSYQRLKHFCQA